MSIIPTKRGPYSPDFSARDILKGIGTIYLVVIPMAIAAWFVPTLIANFLDATINAKEYEEYNVTIDAFNDLPLEDRQLILTWTDYEYNPETFLRPHKAPNPWHHPIPPLSEWQPLPILHFIAIATSFVTVISYQCNRDKKRFYFYDLPRSWSGLLLFIAMFAGWIFILISFLLHGIDWQPVKKSGKNSNRRTRKIA